MSNWSEGALALIIVVGLGIALFLFSGQSLGSDATDVTQAPITVDPEAAARGATLATEQGCLNCHTVDGTSLSGPTWKGLAGSVRPLVGGDEVIADETYLFNSVVDPSNQIVDGYDDLMPDFYADQLNTDQISDLVEYIKSLAT